MSAKDTKRCAIEKNKTILSSTRNHRSLPFFAKSKKKKKILYFIKVCVIGNRVASIKVRLFYQCLMWDMSELKLESAKQTTN